MQASSGMCFFFFIILQCKIVQTSYVSYYSTANNSPFMVPYFSNGEKNTKKIHLHVLCFVFVTHTSLVT